MQNQNIVIIITIVYVKNRKKVERKKIVNVGHLQSRGPFKPRSINKRIDLMFCENVTLHIRKRSQQKKKLIKRLA